MTKEEIFESLKEIFSTVMPGKDLSDVTDGSDLFTGLGMDSLMLLLSSLAIENKFGVRITSDAKFQTVGNVIDYIAERLA